MDAEDIREARSLIAAMESQIAAAKDELRTVKPIQEL
jgi:hypothetical protein